VLFDDLDSHRRSIWAGETDRHIPSGCAQLPEEKARGRVPETIDNVDSRARPGHNHAAWGEIPAERDRLIPPRAVRG